MTRNIIEAATDTGTLWWYQCLNYLRAKYSKNSPIYRFIAHFSPEHVALMEAVIEAYGRLKDSRSDDEYDAREITLRKAYRALTDWRKENGDE